MTKDRKASWFFFALVLPASFAVFAFSPIGYQPDRALASIVPGSSSGPAFRVQIIRPRSGLPFGGILPPLLFGLDAQLGFESKSAGASIGSVSSKRIELSADDWDLVLVLGADGRVSPETQVVFDLVFQERLRRVRCQPGDPADGTLKIAELAESGELSGSFHMQLMRCEDADTGEPIGWPPKPLVLHGSFDRLQPGSGTERR